MNAKPETSPKVCKVYCVEGLYSCGVMAIFADSSDAFDLANRIERGRVVERTIQTGPLEVAGYAQ